MPGREGNSGVTTFYCMEAAQVFDDEASAVSEHAEDQEHDLTAEILDKHRHS